MARKWGEELGLDADPQRFSAPMHLIEGKIHGGQGENRQDKRKFVLAQSRNVT